VVFFPPGTRNDANKLYRKLRGLHYSMKSRCYNPRDTNYKNYGGRGVTVWEGWHNIEDFFNTVESVPGYDEVKLINGELQLDKDYLVKGNKVYSPSTCCFISQNLNAQLKPNRQKEIKAIDPFGERYTFSNTKLFSREHDLSNSCVANCLIGRANTHKGWVFMYSEEGSFEDLLNKYERAKVIVGTAPNGEVHQFTQPAIFGREHDLDNSKIHLCLQGKRNHHKGWVFSYRKD
jgi:hypothetical protein